MSRGARRRGQAEAPRRRDQAGLAARKEAGGRCPRANRPESDRRRAQSLEVADHVPAQLRLVHRHRSRPAPRARQPSPTPSASARFARRSIQASRRHGALAAVLRDRQPLPTDKASVAGGFTPRPSLSDRRAFNRPKLRQEVSPGFTRPAFVERGESPSCLNTAVQRTDFFYYNGQA